MQGEEELALLELGQALQGEEELALLVLEQEELAWQVQVQVLPEEGSA